MPFHHAPLRAALPVRAGLLSQWQTHISRQTFHTSRPLHDDDTAHASKNHYETLNVRTDASQAEIKKSFYTLSKTHHPDHNPSDPHAPKRFMRLSEAYHVLSHADRRRAYDRSLPHTPHHHPARHHGSYSSTGPAGGRPASGLSRRRGTFTGPPPSFFRSGGWGRHDAKRRAAHEETTGTGGPMGGGTAKGAEAAGGGVGKGGMGPGADPLHGTEGAEHFDHAGHERMHRRREEGRSRHPETEVPPVDTGLWARFVIVTGVVVMAAYIPWWFAKGGDGKKTRRKEGV